ncbi:DUF6284 family protein [Micromonospora sp. WMMD1102]|uniref:DUF6284 family protein n=1 Tax=Micromonospora sp. WMMD1102 TaxID=3016105 RepID=UPI0024153280|nr:DUF6284 family protein [Micromonospora sp. WMMD1102]MDG4790002.1 DUF6284 family protein [Micromonospora sp. WMMD1102]
MLPDLDSLEGPSDADLSAIETEWPLIEAELERLDVEITILFAARPLVDLDWQRWRSAQRRVLRAAATLGIPARHAA